MAKIIVDDIEVDVPPEYTLLQAAEEAGAEIPRFCFHERLSIAGNCRMCLVEVKGGPPKPAASCAMAVKDLRPGPNGEAPQIFTKTPMVRKAREGVMEFLLINHPLDCPICDQGGECDLQDQSMAYGGARSRFHENKRAVEDKYIGPLVKTVMNRCIQCTRCVRFTTEVAGVPDLGLTGRGEDVEITTYLEHAMGSELQGNAADLCPVGALTHKPFAFKGRPWEFAKTEAVDVMDAVGSNIRVDSRGREVMRILPRLNEDVNEEWLSDKGRYIVDGLKTQRLDRPYVRRGGRLVPASWSEAFAVVHTAVAASRPERIGGIAGDLASAEEMFAFRALMQGLGTGNMDCRQDGAFADPALGRASYLFNPGIAGIEEADAILLVGAHPRREAAVLNARIRKRWRATGLPIGVVGTATDLTYAVDHLGAGADTLVELAAGRHSFCDVLAAAKRPLIIVGQGALARADGRAVLGLAARIAAAAGAVEDDWNGFAVLHTAAGRVGGLDVGLVPAPGGLDAPGMVAAAGAGALDVLFLLGADEIDTRALGNALVVYIGTHGDAGAHRADVILPAATYTEKHGIWVNTEGRAQRTTRAAFPPGEAREDWAVLRALSGALGATLPFDSFAELRAALFAAVPGLASSALVAADPAAVTALAQAGGAPSATGAFVSPVVDFYLTNPIARASAVMAECSALAQARMAEAAE